MKVTDLRRKLAASLVAGGLMAPSALHAANLDTNLVVNGTFESVDVGTPGQYGAVKILNWADGTSTGFAYGYSLNYDLGGPLTGGGTYYFTPNQSNGLKDDVTAPGTIAQLIDVSAGDTAIAIAAGSATFDLSAFFTSYVLAPGDIGNVQVDFLDAGALSLGSALLSDPDPFAGWKQASTSGGVPVGTAKLLVSLYGTSVVFGPDGYTDNVDLRIVPEASTVVLAGIGLAAAGLGLRRRRDES